MKRIARKQKPTNIFSLVDNAKFKQKQAKSNLYTYTVNGNVFHFQEGDKLICRDYVDEKLNDHTIVITKINDAPVITVAALAENVESIVLSFQREVFND